MPAQSSLRSVFAPELLLAARGPHDEGIAAAIFDVDGVLTDGRVYIGADGEVVKAFATLDGQGLKLLAAGGIVPIVVTGRDSPAVRRRMADLGIGHTAYGADDKLSAANALLERLGLGWDRVAAMGDDWPDLPILRRAAFACAPPQAHIEVRAVGPPCHAGRSRLRRGARAVRPAPGRLRALRRAARRPAVRPRWHAMRSLPSPSATGSMTTRSISASPAPSRSPRRPGRCACSTSSRPTCRCC